jgi:carbonic anhydrase/acetyltransferase-like protein (isoleucine patch superfamily)
MRERRSELPCPFLTKDLRKDKRTARVIRVATVMISAFRGVAPRVDPSVYVAPSAVVIGDVVVGAEASLWFYAIVRGDIGPIRIGARTNLQDHVTVHVVAGKFAVTIGDDVTVGHRAIVHGCTVGNRVLIGMGAIVLDGAEIADDCLIGAGALVPPGMEVPSGRLVLGNPARVARELRADERAHLLTSAANYVGYAAEYRAADLSRA